MALVGLSFFLCKKLLELKARLVFENAFIASKKNTRRVLSLRVGLVFVAIIFVFCFSVLFGSGICGHQVTHKSTALSSETVCLKMPDHRSVTSREDRLSRQGVFGILAGY